ncbi:MAG TPA: hypothetical protein VJ869_16685 [Sphaerochaeta sp.]|nr:hypothetical protein [Sphaerochaeta sp.]
MINIDEEAGQRELSGFSFSLVAGQSLIVLSALDSTKNPPIGSMGGFLYALLEILLSR